MEEITFPNWWAAPDGSSWYTYHGDNIYELEIVAVEAASSVLSILRGCPRDGSENKWRIMRRNDHKTEAAALAWATELRANFEEFLMELIL